jgi:hypothetical protein
MGDDFTPWTLLGTVGTEITTRRTKEDAKCPA